MPSPDAMALHRGLLRKELRDLVRTRPFWALLLLLSPLVGYGFISAVELYGNASRAALPFPEMARGMTPLDGILVPTFGAYYLAAALLFPFIAVRSIGGDRQSGAIKLLVQMPLGPASIVIVKAAALLLAWLVALLPGLSALALWRLGGGHLYYPETANLLAGHSLHALAVTGVAFFVASACDSTASAAIACLGITLGSWVLDFAAGTEGFLRGLSFLSLTAALRSFEGGLFRADAALHLALIGIGLLALTAFWLAPESFLARTGTIAKVASVAVLVAVVGSRTRLSWDLSEDHRNSFGPGIEAALGRMTEPLKITVRLSPDDSRLRDLERNIFDKFRRLVPRLSVAYAKASGDDYGMISYDYGGKVEISRSNSEEEILPILWRLSNQREPPGTVNAYPGYPLVASTGLAAAWFYAILPALIILGGLKCAI